MRLETERSLEIAVGKLSEKFGCGLMLKNLSKFDSSDALMNIMENYGFDKLFADKAGRKTVGNSGLLKSFYDNAFGHKSPLARNFLSVYGKKDVLMAADPKTKTAWFIGETQNRMALPNYFRDAVSLGLKVVGVMLTGSTMRLTPLGWQNLYDLLSDEFIERNPKLKRVEVMSALSGVRWREPSLAIGASYLGFRDLALIQESVAKVMRGEQGGEIQG